MVERFKSYDLGLAGTDPNGGYVRFSDYADLQRQLAEARANGNDWSLEADKYKRALDLKVNEKIAEVQARKAAEADRDRLAAENERLREALEPFAQVAITRIDPPDHEVVKSRHINGLFFGMFKAARAALASLEERG